VALIVLVQEIEAIKNQQGYAAGTWHQYREEMRSGSRPPWNLLVKTLSGMDEGTVCNHSKCRRVVAMRLEGNTEATALLEAQPSKLTETERTALLAHVDAAIQPGETMSSLRREFRMGKQPPAIAAPAPRPVGPLWRPPVCSESEEWEFFGEWISRQAESPTAGFWLLVAAGIQRHREGAILSNAETEALALAYFMGYERHELKLCRQADSIAAMAQTRGASPVEAAAIANMILNDAGSGFLPPSPPPRP
jgi:hypothetical protein